MTGLLWLAAALGLLGLSAIVLGVLGALRDRPWMALPMASSGVGARPPRDALVAALARGPAIAAPMSRRPCLGWELRVYGRWEREGKWSEALAERRVGGRFVVDDGSGPLPLSLDRLAEGGELSGLGGLVEQSRGLGELGAITARGVEFSDGLRLHPARGLLGKAERYRVEERLLDVDQPLLIRVVPGERGPVLAGLRVGERVAATLRGRRQVLWSQVGGGALCLMAALAAGVAALGGAG